MNAILALDQGTTGSMALVIGEDGEVLGRAYEEFTQHYPEPGWVEHDAGEIWDVMLRVARRAVGEADAADLAGIGITNQRETTVLWDRETGEPVCRAIVWQDRRTAARCRELEEVGREALIRERTGLVIDAYFSATKLEWMLGHVPGARERAERGELCFGTVDSWLIWKLTGGRVHATEPTNASRTLLYDTEDHAWDNGLLELFGVPRAVLPEVRPSSGVFGETEPELFGRALPIAGAAGDQQAALFGQGCWTPGLAKNTYGTGAFVLLNTGGERVEPPRGLVTTVCCDAEGGAAYALEGSIFVAGAAVQWLRDELGIIDEAAETERLARGLDSNDGVYFVPAFVGLGAPHWEPDARGTIVGLTRGTGRAQLARAALEAMAYSTREALEAMADAGRSPRELSMDGGAAQNDWLVQFQADVLDLPVKRPKMIETTALGAAGLAGLAVGVWPDTDAFLGSRPEPDRFSSAMDADTRGRLVGDWRRALETAKVWVRAEQAEGGG